MKILPCIILSTIASTANSFPFTISRTPSSIPVDYEQYEVKNTFLCSSSNHWQRKSYFPVFGCHSSKNSDRDVSNDLQRNTHNNCSSRRSILTQFIQSATIAPIITMAATAVTPDPASAGEVGAKINAAVTQSDLGISVRRSVVRGAQVMDKIDGEWEKFSDKFGLGEERSKQSAKPKPKIIPGRLPLNAKIAQDLLTASDMAFVSITGIDENLLRDKIKKIDSSVRKSFERAGTSFESNDQQIPLTGSQYNYFCYIHFRAFSDILIENKVNFKLFLKEFESKMGDAFVKIVLSGTDNSNGVVTSLSSSESLTSPSSLKQKLAAAVQKLDAINTLVRENGLVALAERSELDSEKVDDWANDLSDLQFSISLDGDTTQSAQILLQEQGYRLYPDLIRYGVTTVLKAELGASMQSISADEYYMDTDYNSDPDKFSVKEVLLNIVIESI